MGTTASTTSSALAAAISRREVPWKDSITEPINRRAVWPCGCPRLLGEPTEWMNCRTTPTRQSSIRSLKHNLQPKLEALHEASN